MGTLTKKDMELIQERSSNVCFGTVEIEFRGGVAVAVNDKNRTLTPSGLAKKKPVVNKPYHQG